MASKRRKRKKPSEAKPFWKKIKNPELKHIFEHIGKITDNTSWKDILDVILAAACAYAGWQAGENLGADSKVKTGMALSGAIAYRLATSGNLIAGASGTLLLGAYGLIDVWNPLSQAIASGIGVIKEKIEALPEPEKAMLTWYLTPTAPGLGYIYEKISEALPW